MSNFVDIIFMSDQDDKIFRLSCNILKDKKRYYTDKIMLLEMDIDLNVIHEYNLLYTSEMQKIQYTMLEFKIIFEAIEVFNQLIYEKYSFEVVHYLNTFFEKIRGRSKQIVLLQKCLLKS